MGVGERLDVYVSVQVGERAWLCVEEMMAQWVHVSSCNSLKARGQTRITSRSDNNLLRAVWEGQARHWRTLCACVGVRETDSEFSVCRGKTEDRSTLMWTSLWSVSTASIFHVYLAFHMFFVQHTVHSVYSGQVVTGCICMDMTQSSSQSLTTPFHFTFDPRPEPCAWIHFVHFKG